MASGDDNQPGDWGNQAKDEDAGNESGPDVVVEQEEQEEEDQPKVPHFRPYNLSRKVLADSMEASYFNTTVLVEPYKPAMMDDDVFRKYIQSAQRVYIQAKEESSFIKLTYELHTEAERARTSLQNHLEGCTVDKASKEHKESMVIDGDTIVELLPKNETKAEYRSRMLLVSLLDLADMSSPPQTGEVLDAVLQMFPGARGATMPMPRQRLMDTTFHGFAVVLYSTCEAAKQSYDDWKDKEVFILGKKVKIELYQQVAAETEKKQSKKSDKTENKTSPKAKGHKSVAQTLSEISSAKVSSKPLSVPEREHMTQRMKECKRVLNNLRYMKNTAGPAGAKQRQTIRRQLVQELQRITNILKGDKAAKEDEEEEEEEEDTKNKGTKSNEQKKNKKQANKVTNRKGAPGTPFFTQPQYQNIYPRPYEPKMAANRPPPPPSFLSAPNFQGPRGPRFIPPGSVHQSSPGAPSHQFNMNDVHEVNKSLHDLQQQVEKLSQQFQNAPGALGQQQSRGLLGDYPADYPTSRSRGRGIGRGTSGRGASLYRGYEDEGFGGQHTADVLRGISDLNQRMSNMNVSGDYGEEQFDDYYDEQEYSGGGYQRVQRAPGGYGEPEYTEPYYGGQHRAPGFGGAGRGSGSYSQAKMQGFKQAPQGRGRGILQHH